MSETTSPKPSVSSSPPPRPGRKAPGQPWREARATISVRPSGRPDEVFREKTVHAVEDIVTRHLIELKIGSEAVHHFGQGQAPVTQGEYPEGRRVEEMDAFAGFQIEHRAVRHLVDLGIGRMAKAVFGGEAGHRGRDSSRH